MLDTVVGSQRPLADVAGSLVGIEDLVESLGFSTAVSLDDLSVLKGEADAIKDGALVERLRDVANCAVDAVANCRG